LTSMASVVNIPAGAGDRPTAIQSFETIHHSGKIFDHGQITAANSRNMRTPVSPW
jgi:hypothetical protein